MGRAEVRFGSEYWKKAAEDPELRNEEVAWGRNFELTGILT